MKKPTLTLCILLVTLSFGYCQYKPKFRSLSREELYAAPLIMAQKAKETERYLDAFSNDLLEMRLRNDNPIIDMYLKESYEEVKKFYKMDLASNETKALIKEREKRIKENLVDYSKRYPEGVIMTKSNTHMFSKPSISSNPIGMIKEGEFVKIISHDGNWCRIKYVDLIGYTLNAYLDLPK
jgi:uncharacterized protein YgiM (DUF1202 family)